MTRLGIRMELTANATIQLFRGIKRTGSRLWARRTMAKASTISGRIGNMLVLTFNQTPVAQALRGQSIEDLPAHFGLSDSMANALVDGMGNLIKSSVRLLSRGNEGGVSIRIQAVEKNWDNYLNLPGARYLSHPSNIIIPVVKWLLVDPTIDIGAGAYDIIFRGEDQKFDAQIQKVSRSGRAIMVALSALGGGGGYVLPSIVSGQAGQNFIEYSLGQPGVAQRAAQILMGIP